MECEYCKNLFSTKANLNSHQKTAKYCLKLRETNSVKECVCHKCGKKFNREYVLNRHLDRCSSKNSMYDLEKNIIEYKAILNEKENYIVELKKQYEKHIRNQEDKYEKQVKELQDKLENLAKTAISRPTTTNTMTNSNTNNIMNLAPLDMNVLTEKLKTVINENMTEQHLLEGQEGIAKLIASCFTLEDGKKLITCTDTSRGIWKTKDKNGNILKDVKANNIAKTVQPIAVSKADVLIDLDGKKRNKIYELRDIEKRKKERLELDEKDEATMKGMKVGSGHYRMYEERIKKRYEERQKDEKIEEQLMEEFREADELYLIHLDDDEKPFKLYAGKEEIKNLKDDSIKFSNSLVSLV
jgi:hypothetical protein